MSLLEFIGFIVSMATLVFLSFRKYQDERKRRENPAEYERELEEKDKRLKKFLKSLEGDMEEKDEDEDEFEEEDEYEEDEEEERIAHKPPPPPPVPIQQPQAAKNLLPNIPLKPVSKAGENFGFKPKLEEYKITSKIDEQHLTSKLDWRYQKESEASAYNLPDKKTHDAIKTKDISTVKELLIKLPSKKDMVVLHEILGLPKGLR